MKVFVCLWALTTVANAGLLYGGSSGFAAGVSTDSDVSFNDESGRTAGSLSSGGPTTTIRAISDVGEGSTTGGWSNGGDSSDSRCHEGGCSSGDAESVISDAEDKSSAGSAGGWPAVETSAFIMAGDDGSWLNESSAGG
uniref:Uncharacterized protein n=1 Tax=Stomoxys calcitrans TaxID=35570 RepID=A0A1I8P335_STOCA